MAIVKIKAAGESVTWRIKDAQEVSGNYGPQVKFEDADSGDVMFLPADSAQRQLDRIPLTLAQCAGETLTISRDPNPKPGSAPFWGIRVAESGERNAQPTKRLTHAEATQPKGKYIPGIDGPEFPPEGDEDLDPYAHLPVHQAGTRVPSAEASRTAPNASKRAAIADDYLALLAHVRKSVPNFSDDAAQAAAATIFIQWKNAGLV